jgi:hypothetical protein
MLFEEPRKGVQMNEQSGKNDRIAMHGFRNARDRDVKLLLTCAAALGRFFEEAGSPLNENESTRKCFIRRNPACARNSAETWATLSCLIG